MPLNHVCCPNATKAPCLTQADSLKDEGLISGSAPAELKLQRCILKSTDVVIQISHHGDALRILATMDNYTRIDFMPPPNNQVATRLGASIKTVLEPCGAWAVLGIRLHQRMMLVDLAHGLPCNPLQSCSSDRHPPRLEYQVLRDMNTKSSYQMVLAVRSPLPTGSLTGWSSSTASQSLCPLRSSKLSLRGGAIVFLSACSALRAAMQCMYRRSTELFWLAITVVLD